MKILINTELTKKGFTQAETVIISSLINYIIKYHTVKYYCGNKNKGYLGVIDVNYLITNLKYSKITINKAITKAEEKGLINIFFGRKVNDGQNAGKQRFILPNIQLMNEEYGFNYEITEEYEIAFNNWKPNKLDIRDINLPTEETNTDDLSNSKVKLTLTTNLNEKVAENENKLAIVASSHQSKENIKENNELSSVGKYIIDNYPKYGYSIWLKYYSKLSEKENKIVREMLCI